MDELARLMARSDQVPPSATATLPAFVIDPAAEEVGQLIGILAVFAAAGEDAILVYRGTEWAGSIDRTAVLELCDDLEMSPGAGQHFVLPGDPQDAFVTLSCERPDCRRRIYATFYAQDDPPMCPDHPGSGTRPVQ